MKCQRYTTDEAFLPRQSLERGAVEQKGYGMYRLPFLSAAARADAILDAGGHIQAFFPTIIIELHS